MAVAQSEVRFGFQSEREEQFPILVQLALLHYICNSYCQKCPVGLMRRKEMGQDQQGEFDPAKRGFMPFSLFVKIADEMARYPWSILRFHGRGEPLLHPNYVRMIEYAKSVGVGTVTSFTNVTLLDAEIAGKILDAGIDLLELSVDAYSEDLYRQFRGTEYFKTVIENAENFIRARNRRGNTTKTRVIVSAVDCPEFKQEKEDFRRFWEERADMVIFRPYHTYGGRLPPMPQLDTPEIVPCAQLWTRFSINHKGKVNACFNDWADIEIVGDLNEKGATIAKIWRGEKFEAIRQAALKRNSVLECCKHCLATIEGWTKSYQLLLQKLKDKPPNRSLI